MSNLVGLNVGLSDSLSKKTRRFADYYRQLAAGTLKEVYDDETVTLSACFYRSPVEKATFTKCKNIPSYGGFYLCSKLFSVDFPELTRIGVYSFSGTSKLTNISFPKVTEIVNLAFESSGVETVDLTACTTLSYAVFSFCAKLKEIKIPICGNIGQKCFYNCKSLEKIFLDGVTAVPTLGTDVLTGTPEGLKIIVPDALVDSFKVATNWSAYADKIVGISEYNATT